MSNIMSAATRIRTVYISLIRGEESHRLAEYAARWLQDDGLLAPDLPEPRIDIDGWQEWGHKHGNRVTLENGMVTLVIPDDISRDLTREEAQELAAWLHAAANHAVVVNQ